MEPNRAIQSGYNLLNVRAGVSNDDWMAEVYIDNCLMKEAKLLIIFFDRERVALLDLATVGLRYKKDFLISYLDI